MKTIKYIFYAILAYCLTICQAVYAQYDDPELLATLNKVKYLPEDYNANAFNQDGVITTSFAKNFKNWNFILALDGERVTYYPSSGLPTGDFTIEQQCFGAEGNTIVIYGTTVLEGGPEVGFSYSFSGKNIKIDNVSNVHTIYNGVKNANHCGATLTYLDNRDAWVLDVKDNNGITTVSDIYRGMTVSELKSLLSAMGAYTLTPRKENRYTVYTLSLPSISKAYKWWNPDDYHYVAGMKGYGRFYFDTKGKLIKWIISTKSGRRDTILY